MYPRFISLPHLPPPILLPSPSFSAMTLLVSSGTLNSTIPASSPLFSFKLTAIVESVSVHHSKLSHSTHSMDVLDDYYASGVQDNPALGEYLLVR